MRRAANSFLFASFSFLFIPLALLAQNGGMVPVVSQFSTSEAGSEQVSAQAPVPSASFQCDEPLGFDFSKVPPSIRPLSRAGIFPNPPTGPGYYSAMDWLTDTYREKRPPYPYTPFALSSLSFFDADWRYVDSPDHDADFLERIKRIHVADNWLVATGGQAWYRYQNEYNARLTEQNNISPLVRTRAYLDVWYQDKFRFFIEGIYADNVSHDIAPLPTDIDRGDFQNLFADAKLFDVDGKPVYARVGRQEMGLGSQRLVGTPDWGNTRRTFQGARLFRNGEDWDADLFWMQPVFPNPTELDSGDFKQNFAGAFVTYKPQKGTFIDAYYLFLDNANVVVQTGIVRAPITLHTIGGRIIGDVNDEWLYETEAAIQLGRQGDASVLASMLTSGVGYHWKNLPWNPTFWAYYNYTSGDQDPNHGNFSTFNQLFPYIHYYMGWVDAVGRQNDHDLNLRCYLYPTNWVTVWLQYHQYWLVSSKDALYNIAGNAYRRDPTGNAGNDVGQKAEIMTNFHLSQRTDLFVGYSYLWGGNFLKNTAGPNAAVDGSIFSMGYSIRW